MLVDHHAHWLPEALLVRLSHRREPPMSWYTDGCWFFRAGVLARALPAEAFDLERRCAQLRTLGISRQVLSWSPLWNLDALPPEEAQSAAEQFNDETAAHVRANGSYRGLAVVPIAYPAAAANELRRAHGLGLEGFVLPAWSLASRRVAVRVAPLFEAAQDLRMRVFVHPGRLPAATTAGEPATAADRLRHLGLEPQHEVGQAMLTLCFTDWLDTFPGVTVQVANGGGSFVAALERLRRMAVDYPAPAHPRTALRMQQIRVDAASLGPVGIAAARALLGAESVVFGTDTPIFGVRSAVADWLGASRRRDNGPAAPWPSLGP